MPYYMFI